MKFIFNKLYFMIHTFKPEYTRTHFAFTNSSFLILPHPSSSFLILPRPSSSFLILPHPSSSFLILPSSSFTILPHPSPSFLILPHPSSSFPILPHPFLIPSLDFFYSSPFIICKERGEKEEKWGWENVEKGDKNGKKVR